MYCENQPVLPIGLSDVPGEAMVKLYCPKCLDVYNPKSSRHHHIDGVYFGTGFPHMLFMVHPELRPPNPTQKFTARYVTMSFPTCVVLYAFILYTLNLHVSILHVKYLSRSCRVYRRLRLIDTSGFAPLVTIRQRCLYTRYRVWRGTLASV